MFTKLHCSTPIIISELEIINFFNLSLLTNFYTPLKSSGCLNWYNRKNDMNFSVCEYLSMVLLISKNHDFAHPYCISSVILIMWLSCTQIWLSCILHILSFAENETDLYWIFSAILIMWLGHTDDMIYLNWTPSAVLHYPIQYCT